MTIPQLTVLQVLKELTRWLVDIWKTKFSDVFKVRGLFKLSNPFKLLPMTIYMEIPFISKVYIYEALQDGYLWYLQGTASSASNELVIQRLLSVTNSYQKTTPPLHFYSASLFFLEKRNTQQFLSVMTWTPSANQDIAHDQIITCLKKNSSSSALASCGADVFLFGVLMSVYQERTIDAKCPQASDLSCGRHQEKMNLGWKNADVVHAGDLNMYVL